MFARMKHESHMLRPVAAFDTNRRGPDLQESVFCVVLQAVRTRKCNEYHVALFAFMRPLPS